MPGLKRIKKGFIDTSNYMAAEGDRGSQLLK